MSNKTNTIGLTKPMPGSRNWGQVMNNNLDAIDQAFQNSNNKLDYVNNTLNSLNYLDIQEGEDWCVIGREGLLNKGEELTRSQIQDRDTIDSEEGCFYTGTIIGNDDSAKFKVDKAFTTDNASELVAYNNYRGFYLFYSSPKNSSWTNITDPLFDKFPWDPSFNWQIGEIVVKKPYIKQGEATKISFTKFTQALGGYYIPEQIIGSTDLKFKKALYHEAKDEQIIHFPAGFMDATYSETTLENKNEGSSNQFKINLNDQLANSNINDYSNVEVKFFENEGTGFNRKQVMFEYNIEYNLSDKKYYCIITPHTDITPSEITVRFISYRKVNKLTFAAYFSKN